VGVLRNLPDQGLAVSLGHPVLGLDLDAGIDARLKRAFVVGHILGRADGVQAGLHHLCVHGCLQMIPNYGAIIRYNICMTTIFLTQIIFMYPIGKLTK
jgi:hypothetical protein